MYNYKRVGGANMKKNGFIASALLYSILALFLVLIMSTLAILGNRKLGMDKIKSDASNTVRFEYSQMGSIYSIYDGFQKPVTKDGKTTWKDQSGNGRDATLTNVTYSNRHLVFNGNGSVNTNINQSSLGNQFTLQTILNVKNVVSTSESIGLWGWYDASSKQGIFAEIGTIPGDTTNTKAFNLCAYTSVDTSVPSCVNVGLEFLHAGQLVHITFVITNENINYDISDATITEPVVAVRKGIDVYINGTHYDRLDIDSAFTVKPFSTLILGQSSNNSQKFNGDLYNFTIYNKALTYEEVTKNFNADKIKYNIPV